MKTHVVVISGPRRSRIGTVAGSLSDRVAKGITRAFVSFPQLAHSEDLRSIPVANLREATAGEILIFETDLKNRISR
jgi:hypothetical protein